MGCLLGAKLWCDGPLVAGLLTLNVDVILFLCNLNNMCLPAGMLFALARPTFDVDADVIIDVDADFFCVMARDCPNADVLAFARPNADVVIVLCDLNQLGLRNLGVFINAVTNHGLRNNTGLNHKLGLRNKSLNRCISH